MADQKYNIIIDEAQRQAIEAGLALLKGTNGAYERGPAEIELEDLAGMIEELPKLEAQHRFATQGKGPGLQHDFTL